MRTTAILPVKSFGRAKQRLGAAFPDRPRLAAAMVGDVLAALARVPGLDDVVVVTAEPAAAAAARAAGAHVVHDPEESGQSAAAARGIAAARERGAERVLLVPGDCPALDPGEVDELLIVHPGAEARVTIVPDRHDTGTNALVLTPPDAISPSFGPGSRARHEAAARATGAEVRLAHPPSLLLDVDTLEDLDALRAALRARTGGAAHTRGLLARLERR
jgi:2-phospho-L-lactate/phosphoenolpyruvate guanylyltransferase